MTFPSDESILKAAADCETLSQLWKAFPEVRDFQSIKATCKRLGISLPVIRPNRPGAPRPKQAVPKADLPVPGKARGKGNA